MVTARWTVRGTHKGDSQGIPPTGTAITLSGATVHHLSAGRIAKTWLVFDRLDLLQQLGAAPQPNQA